MKFLVVLALFAAASAEPEAEADPYFYYATHGAYPYTYGYHGYPYVYNTLAAPVVAKAAEPVEEKAAEPVEEKKPVVYTYPHVYGAYPYAHYNYAPVTYASHYVKPYSYYANSGGAVHVVKREAEAKADPEAWYSAYSGYHPYAYNYGYRYSPYTYGYGYPYGYARYGYSGYHGYYYGK